jgi:pyrroline-5-carboxylate reductase
MKIGFIGMGNMALAIAEGWVKKELVAGTDICAFAPNQEKLANNAARIGFVPMASAKAVVSAADTIVIACKPYQIEKVLAELGNNLFGKAIWSVAAGWTYDTFEKQLSGIVGIDDSVRIQCIMPNTPAMVGEGVFLFEEKNSLKPAELTEMKRLFEGLGVVIPLPTELMGIGGYISGCGPAFVDMFMEAYADAAVKYGLPRATAYKLISQTVLGSAKMVLETGRHPGELKDMVCSPGGTTMEAVRVLEEKGFRSAIIEAEKACVSKSRGM